MASKQHLPTMDNLPEDILGKIFFCLKAKQLAQMRSVCPFWNTLLSQPSFVKSHLHHSINNNEQILLLFSHGRPKPFTARLARAPCFVHIDFVKFPPAIPEYVPRSSTTCVIGSVNGLICFSYGSSSHDDSSVHIWNPSLSALVTLPPHFNMPPNDYHNPSGIQFRFGFDPKTDDYKVVKLRTTSCRRRSKNAFGSWLYIVEGAVEVEVYSMRKGYSRLVNPHGFPLQVQNITLRDFVCVDGHDGHVHWLGYNDDMRLKTIVAFDLGDEVFHEVPLPDSILEHNACTYFVVLGVLNRKLCVMVTVRDGECEVWVMEEYGVVDSWVKKYDRYFARFSDSKLIAPYGFTLHNEFLFLDDEYIEGDGYSGWNTRLVLYNPSLAKAKFFSSVCRQFDMIVAYVDSLVWVAPVGSKPSCCGISRLQI